MELGKGRLVELSENAEDTELLPPVSQTASSLGIGVRCT